MIPPADDGPAVPPSDDDLLQRGVCQICDHARTERDWARDGIEPRFNGFSASPEHWAWLQVWHLRGHPLWPDAHEDWRRSVELRLQSLEARSLRSPSTETPDK